MPDVVGGGYGAFWRFRGRYRVVKGSRASKKSKTTALWYIYNLMKYPGSNLLVIRKIGRTIKDSCFTELKWAVHRLQVDSLWAVKESPLEMTYIPTGQKIYFRGLDDPIKITSITAETGALCWVWIEEAYEITKESDFDMIDESIRGEVPDGLFKQITLTFNPWSDRCWIRHRFFDVRTGTDENGRPVYQAREGPVSEDGQILAMTTDYRCNEWLDDSDRRLFEDMKKRNPGRYQVAGLGNWGVVEGVNLPTTSVCADAENPQKHGLFWLSAMKMYISDFQNLHFSGVLPPCAKWFIKTCSMNLCAKGQEADEHGEKAGMTRISEELCSSVRVIEKSLNLYIGNDRM